MLGDKLMKLRRKQGLSQQEAADVLSVSRQTISNWECGQGAPALDKALELARLYHVSLDDLSDDVEVVTSTAPTGKDRHVLLELKGATCKIDFCDLYMIGVGSNYRNLPMHILDVNEDWLRVSYQRPVGLFKRETVIQLIDLDGINGFTVIETSSEDQVGEGGEV